MQRYFSSGERRGLVLLGIAMAVTTAIAFLTSERSGQDAPSPTEVATAAETTQSITDTSSIANTGSPAPRNRRKAPKTQRNRKTSPPPAPRSPLDEPF